jgi:RNA polymerase sigma-70 factor (ECF subfamily)
VQASSSRHGTATRSIDSRRADEVRLAELMRRSQDGDAVAYAALLEDLVDRLRRFLGAVGRGGRFGDSAALEDLVQETLLSLHTRRHTYDPALPFLPWLHGIARYKAIDHLRRRGAQRRFVERLVEVSLAELDVAGAPGPTAPREAREEIEAALASLPGAQRRIIELAKLGEMSVAEVAEETGNSQANVKVLTYRAMKALRRYFERRTHADE